MTKVRNLWAGVFFLMVFIFLGILVRSKPTSFDLSVAKFFAAHRTHVEISVASFVSTVVAPVVIGTVATVLLVLWYLIKQQRTAQDVVPIALIVVAGAASTLAKSIFHRVRPGATLSTILDAEPSFPSSHTIFIAVAGSTLLFVFAKWHLAIVAAILVAVVFVGLDRLVLGVHWFTDLLGSGLLSLGLYFLFLYINQSLQPNPYRRTRVR